MFIHLSEDSPLPSSTPTPSRPAPRWGRPVAWALTLTLLVCTAAAVALVVRDVTARLEASPAPAGEQISPQGWLALAILGCAAAGFLAVLFAAIRLYLAALRYLERHRSTP
jgi:hypothetical protein